MEIKVPNRFTFLLVRNVKTGEQTVTASINKTKCQLSNLKFKDVQHFSWKAEERVTTLEVIDFKREEDFKNKLDELTHQWGIEVDKSSNVCKVAK